MSGGAGRHWVELRSQAESMGRRLDQSLGDVHAVKRQHPCRHARIVLASRANAWKSV